MAKLLNFFILLLLLLFILGQLGECGGKKGKGSKKKKKGGNGSKNENTDAEGNEAEPSELADLGDSPKIHEGEDQKRKSEKGKSVDAGPSSDVMAVAAAQHVENRAQYLGGSLSQFKFENFLNREIASPKTNKEYKSLLDDAQDHLLNFEKDKGQTINNILELIKEGLQGRTMKYIRLIGAGSLRQHDEHYNYAKETRAEHMAVLELIKKEAGNDYYAKLYSQQHQIFAIYQLVLAKLIAEQFNVEHVTVEDMHLALKEKGVLIPDEQFKVKHVIVEDSEQKFLKEILGYTPILGNNGPQGNLVKIPNQVAKMSPEDVTMIIMINCGIEMTTNLIKSYGKDRAKQLILLESSMNKQIKVTTMEQKNWLNENLKLFPIRKPLNANFWAERVYQQKMAQISYSKLTKN